MTHVLTRTTAALGATLAAGLLVTACSNSSSSAPPASTGAGSTSMSSMSTMPSSGGGSSRTITIHTTNMLRFDPMSISVPTGKVTIKLVDDGSYPHNLLIPSLKTKSKTVTGDLGGSSTTFTVTFPHPGAYPFECTYHDSAGMKGVFHVTG